MSASVDPAQERDLMRQKAAYEKEKGNKSFNSGQYKEAIEHYTNGIRCDPSEPTILCNRAMAYLKLNEYAKAKIDCDLAIALDGTYVKAIYRRALAYLGMNDVNAARTNFRRVLELEPSNRLAMDELKKLESMDRGSDRAMTTGKTVGKNDHSTAPVNAKSVAKAPEDPLLVIPVKDPPAEWKAQPLTRITNIEEVTTAVAHTSITNGIGQASPVPGSAQAADSLCQDFSSIRSSTPGSVVGPSAAVSSAKPALASSTAGHKTEPASGLSASGHNAEFSPSPSTSHDHIEVLPVPKTSVEFFSRWGTMKRRNMGEAFERYFMTIPMESYNDLFGCLIESDILSDVIKTFSHVVRSDATLLTSVSKRLLQLSKLERFHMAYMFLDETDKQAVKDIVNNLSEAGKSAGDHDMADLISSLRMAYEL